MVHNSSQEFHHSLTSIPWGFRKPYLITIHLIFCTQQSAMTGQGASIILNSRTLFWSLPNLHSRFLIQLDEHWVFIPTVSHGIDPCVQDRLLFQSHLHSVSQVPTAWPQVVLKPASKRKRNTSSTTLSPLKSQIQLCLQEILYSGNKRHLQLILLFGQW